MVPCLATRGADNVLYNSITLSHYVKRDKLLVVIKCFHCPCRCIEILKILNMFRRYVSFKYCKGWTYSDVTYPSYTAKAEHIQTLRVLQILQRLNIFRRYVSFIYCKGWTYSDVMCPSNTAKAEHIQTLRVLQILQRLNIFRRYVSFKWINTN